MVARRAPQCSQRVASDSAGAPHMGQFSVWADMIPDCPGPLRLATNYPGPKSSLERGPDGSHSRQVTNAWPKLLIFFLNNRIPFIVHSSNECYGKIMNIRFSWIYVIGGLAAAVTGCVERRVEYVPVYRTQPAYAYPAPGAPAIAAPAPVATNADGTAAAVAPQALAPANAAVVAEAPPAPQMEVVPVAPGPDYVWIPGYWSVGIGGGWIWVGGHYAYPPRPHAVWMGGHWGRRGHGYVWIGGRWR